MLIGYKRGQGSIVLRVKILNSSVSTGAGLTGLTSASSGLIISTIADNESTATAYTVAGSTIEGITTLGTYAAPTATKCRFKEVDSTNHKGVYEIQIADARFEVSSAKSLLVSVSGATNAAETDVVIPLRDLDPYDSVRGGMTALPNATPAGSGGLPTVNSSNYVAGIQGTKNTLDSLNDITVAAVWAKTMTELSAVPGVTADVLSALSWVFELARNKRTQTATTETVLKDDGSTTLATSTKSDDGTTFTRGEYS